MRSRAIPFALAFAAALTVGATAPARSAPQTPMGCDDLYDPNTTCAVATLMTVGTYPGLGVALFPADDDFYKIWLPQNATLAVDLSFTHANGDIDLRLYNGCGGTQVAVSQGTTNTEHISYKNTSFSRYFYVRVTLISQSCNAYSMTLGITSADNANVTATPPGWSYPTVPRDVNNSTTGSAPLPGTLVGNGNTWLNAATYITGPENFPAFDSHVFVDDSLTQAYNFVDNSTPGLWTGLNSGPHTIRGGRHTLRHQADVDDEFFETNESDNQWSMQFVWTPLVTAYQVPHVRAYPPLKGSGTYKNADGASFIRMSNVAWVLAEAPLTPGDDYDLRVYSDYANSTSGFTTLIGSSSVSTNGTDFVVGHFSGTPTTLYLGVERFLANHAGDYVLDQSDARNRNGNLQTTAAFSWTPISLVANRVADVYEARMTAGLTYYFSLRLLSGSTPLGFRVFPATVGGIYGTTSGTTSTGAGNLQTLAFTATETGWHPIVVYRKTGTDAGTAASYDFEWSTTGLVGVPGPSAGATLDLAAPVPNPIRARGRIAYTLPAAGRVRVGIFDVHGRQVRGLVDGWQAEGGHAIEWDGSGEDGGRAAAGIYWARLQFGGGTRARRVALLP